MLDAMRKHSQSFLIYVVFGVLILVFAFSFGPGSGSCGGTVTDYAAKVDGDIVRREDFVLRLNSQLEGYRRNFAGAGGLSEEMIEALGIRDRVIDELIQRKLLAQAGHRHGLAVSDEELLAYLKERYGVDRVSYAQYERWVVRTIQSTVPRFEDEVRDDIIGEKMARVVRDAVAVSNDELEANYRRENDRAMVNFIRFDTAEVTVPEPADAAIDALLAERADQVKLRYDEDILKYRTSKEVKARQILKRLPRDADDAAVATARNALMELKTQLDGGADFAALAKTESDDEATKEKGGDMGFIKRGQVIKPLADAAFALEKDGVTAEPVRTPMGLHLIQVTEIKPPARKELKDVEREVAISILKDEATDAAARAKGEALAQKLRDGGKLEELTWTEDEEREATEAEKATNARPVRRKTAWILKSQESIPQIGASAELLEEIFSLTSEQPIGKTVHHVGRSYFVVTLEERQVPDMADFASRQEALREQALSAKRGQVFNEYLKHLRDSADVLLNPDLFPPKEEKKTDLGAAS